MKVRITVLAIAVAGLVLALAPAAFAKGTLFVVGSGSSTVAAHSIGEGGGLSPVGGAVATGNTPRSAAVSPNAQHLYVSSVGADNISIYSIAASGALTPVTTVGAGTDPEGIAITPNGVFLYVANQGSNNISGYSIAAGGVLVPLGGSPFAAAQVKEIAITSDGLHLYASTDAGVRAYDIAQDTGALTPVGGVTAAGTNPKGLATTPDSRFVYVSNNGSANVTGFSIGTTGELTSIGSFPTGNVPQTIAVSADGRFLYSANFGSNNAGAFSIGADGALTPVPGQPFAADTQPYGIDAAPNARNVYVSNFNNNLAAPINGYAVGAEGGLAQLPGSPFTSGVNGSEFQSIAITPNQGPTAIFTASPEGAGNPAAFNATSSSDSDGGTVVRYDWDFGDGTVLPDGGPTPTHVYANAGNYEVALTVTDDEGCSNLVLFTGQTADCNGSSSARMTQTVPISASDTPPNLKLSAKKQELSKKVVVKAKTADDTDAVAKGSVKIDPKKGNNKSYDLKKYKADLEGGEKEKLKPKLSKKAYKKARKALKNKAKVKAKVKVKVTDANADTDKDSVKVKLTKP